MGHEGEHVALGIHEVGLWARKIVSDCNLETSNLAYCLVMYNMMEKLMKIA